VTKFDSGTVLTSQVMDCQMQAIGKAISPFLQISGNNFVVSTYLNTCPTVNYCCIEM